MKRGGVNVPNLEIEKGSRIIGVRFPVDHPIWNYPEGQRASWIRKLVDLLLIGKIDFLVEQMVEVKNAVMRLEERLDALEAVSPKKPEPPPAVKIDPAAFLDI
jgi:hypothetical protein